MVREVPGGTAELPSAALATNGGGTVTLDPTKQNELVALTRYFQFDVAADLSANSELLGSRVYVRFSHRREPLATQWARRLRQLFLSHFNV